MGGGIRGVLGTCQLREGAVEGTPAPVRAAGPVPTRSRALRARSSGSALEEVVSHHRGTQRAAGAAAQAGARVGTLYFYTLNKNPDNKPKPRPPPFLSPRWRRCACAAAAAARELRVRGAGAASPWRRRRRCGPRRRPCGGSNRTRPMLTRCGGSGAPGMGCWGSSSMAGSGGE